MKVIPLDLVRIGNSRGIRLPAELIRKHGFEAGVILQDHGDGISLKPKRSAKKLSLADTYKEMAAAAEDWSEWDSTLADGLDEIPWQVPPRKPPANPKQTRRKR